MSEKRHLHFPEVRVNSRETQALQRPDLKTEFLLQPRTKTRGNDPLGMRPRFEMLMASDHQDHPDPDNVPPGEGNRLFRQYYIEAKLGLFLGMFLSTIFKGIAWALMSETLFLGTLGWVAGRFLRGSMYFMTHEGDSGPMISSIIGIGFAYVIYTVITTAFATNPLLLAALPFLGAGYLLGYFQGLILPKIFGGKK